MAVVTAVAMVSTIKREGLAWWAPPCSSWVWMSRHSTSRTAVAPLGTRLRNHPSVVANNRLVSRLCILLDMCWKRGVYYIIEQPATSLMWQHPRLMALLQKHGAQTIVTEMGAFGGDYQKPSKLVRTHPLIASLVRLMTPEEKRAMQKRKKMYNVPISTLSIKNGKSNYSGSKFLKATRAYPKQLGLAVGMMFSEHELTIAPDAERGPGAIDNSGGDMVGP